MPVTYRARPLWAAVPAAGRGSRYGGGRPKQYERLAGRAVLDWSVSALLGLDEIAGVAVALADDDADWATLAVASDPRVYRCRGGRERSDSVRAALEALLAAGASPHDRVLVHDAARPAVSTAALQRLIQQADPRDGGLLALPVADTLKRGEAGYSTGTVDRSGLWAAQTPQLFPLGALRTALEAAVAEGVVPTDEASAMERTGAHPALVPGEPGNIKLTRTADRELLAAVLAARQEGRET